MAFTLLNIVLSLLVSSGKDPGNVTQSEWTILEDVQAAISALLAKKPANMQ